MLEKKSYLLNDMNDLCWTVDRGEAQEFDPVERRHHVLTVT